MPPQGNKLESSNQYIRNIFLKISTNSGNYKEIKSTSQHHTTPSRKKTLPIVASVLLLLVSFFTFAILGNMSLSPWGIHYGNNTLVTPNYTVESLTRDVQVKNIHSHNDYWRSEPFFEALTFGVISIEADVWHFPSGLEIETYTESTNSSSKDIKSFSNEEIYVGHSLVYLQPKRTLNNLYLDPIYNLLKDSNPKLTYENHSSASFQGEPPLHGVFYDFPDQTLYLWFDIKTASNDTYNGLKPLLKRFIDNNWLTSYDTSTKKLSPGPVTITLTGNLPTELVSSEEIRYVFLDAPLLNFNLTSNGKADLNSTALLSQVASGSLQSILGDESYKEALRSDFSPDQLAKIKDHVDTAHKYNLKTRIWGGVTWPNYVKLAQNKGYYLIGVDLLNTDDIAQFANSF